MLNPEDITAKAKDFQKALVKAREQVESGYVPPEVAEKAKALRLALEDLMNSISK